MIKYLFDLDGTLFFTNALNNCSDNVALEDNGYPPIDSTRRITRKTVIDTYHDMSSHLMANVIRQKQDYFLSHLDMVGANQLLFSLVRKLDWSNCFLWTSSDSLRAATIVESFNVRQLFNRCIHTQKVDIKGDIEGICNALSCSRNQLLVFENDMDIARKLIDNNVSCLLFMTPCAE